MAVVDFARGQVAHAAHVLPRWSPVVDRPILVAEGAAAGGVIDVELPVGHRRAARVGDDPFGMPLSRRGVGSPAAIVFRRRRDPRILGPHLLGKAEHAEAVFAAVEHDRDRHASLLQLPQRGGAVFAGHLPDGVGGFGAPDRAFALAPLGAVHGLRLSVQHLAVLVAGPRVGRRFLRGQATRTDDGDGIAGGISLGEGRQLGFIALRIVQPGDHRIVHIAAELDGIAPVLGQLDPGIGGQHPAESRQPRQRVAVTEGGLFLCLEPLRGRDHLGASGRRRSGGVRRCRPRLASPGKQEGKPSEAKPCASADGNRRANAHGTVSCWT